MLTRSQHWLANDCETIFKELLPPADDDEYYSDHEDDEVETESEHEFEESAEEEADFEYMTDIQKRGRRAFLKSNCGYEWSLDAPQQHDISSRRDFHPTLKNDALNAKTPLETWSILITDEILNKIVFYTNEQIARVVSYRNNICAYEKSIDLIEFKSFIGLLYYAGLFKLNNDGINHLWSPHCLPLFNCTMSKNRFEFILQNLRFDDKNKRAEHRLNDRLTQIREIWNMFMSNCRANYEPGNNCYLEKQLLSFRGRCSFKVCIPSKPEKCGIQILTINDADTCYLFDAIPYCANKMKQPKETDPSNYVHELCKSIYHTGRVLVCDKWFTSVPLCDKLRKEYNLNMVGNIKKNKPEIPPALKQVPKDGSNVLFAYNDGKVLVRYNPEPRKVVLLLSSFHSVGEVDEITQMPNVVLFYNKIKGGMDNFERNCHNFTTTRRTNRWPLRLFFGILDQASVNSCILLSLQRYTKFLQCSEFVMQLVMSLVKPALKRRYVCQTTQYGLRKKILEFFEEGDLPEERDLPYNVPDNKIDKPKLCAYCPISINRRTKFICVKCNSPMCRYHTAKKCQNCIK